MNVTIRFSDQIQSLLDYCEVTLTNNNGIVMDQSKMTIDEFIKCLTESTFFDQDEEKTITTLSPILPMNCPFYFEKKRKNSVVRYIPIIVEKNKWDIMVHNTLFLNVGFPKLLIIYPLVESLEGLKIMGNIKIFALKDEAISEETSLYKFPFSNVSNGNLCLGTNKKPSINSYADLTNLHKKFLFNTPFTDDYYSNRNASSASNVREFVISMKDKDFDDELLISKNIQIKELEKIIH